MEVYSQSILAIDEVFRRLAFGYNGGDTPHTSTAVAYGLILNYFDQTVDNRVLPDILKAEALRGSVFDAQRYPQAAYLHKYLLRHGRLAPGPLGRWGKGVIRRLKRFWRMKVWHQGVTVHGRFGGYGAQKAWKLIKREIDSNRPAMVTAFYGQVQDKGELFRTMVACGYRIISPGRCEILVHTGRYDRHIKGSRAQLLYIPLRSVMCSYSFNVALLASAL
ncbi:MAG: hypothetical protein LBK67_09990 [Coriobacteriales bacterium]|jgi:hypothetical protein|nr:hypothetical protein [Coriobacteriales bacterium]